MSGMDVLSEPRLPIDSPTGLAMENSAEGLPTEWRGRPHMDRPQPAITLALIGGQRLLRDATASLLMAQDGLQVLGAYASAAEFLTVAWERPPTVLLLDWDGGEQGNCGTALQALSPATAHSRIVLLCRTVCEQVVHCAIEHRASGVLLKSYSTEDIVAALAYTATGRTVLPAGWQLLLPDQLGNGARLSPRHRQILALIAAGRSNEEIALDLELSPNTIKFHIRALYSRLGVRNRVEAANLHAQIASGDA
jgi:DNA-binding NarL/FixJ family response regulator